MPRYTEKQYRNQVALLMGVYVAIMFLVWPHIRSASSLSWKVVVSLVAVTPVVVVIWLMAKRVMHSDELQQRLHLTALSVATGMVCSLSLVGGFLCAAGVLALDGDILIWVAPALSMIYGVTHWWLGRRYGGAGCP
jgi:RsiW-degrading membrane proteinase PrsW (M82 family)